MLARSCGCTLVGLESHPVEVEVDVGPGLPGFTIVGLPDTSVQESKERVRAAIRNSGFEFPAKRITVNLAPADLRKEGPGLDLAIAVALLAATRQLPAEALGDYLMVGELSLEGKLRPGQGVLVAAGGLKNRGLKMTMVVPGVNAAEAALVEGVKVLGATDLSQVVSWLRGEVELPIGRANPEALSPPGPEASDLAEVVGQQLAKRALEIAAAGHHNILLVGPPGSGKTMLARRLSGLLPPMTIEERLKVSKIYSIAGLLPPDEPLLSVRPFRAPHHTASTVSIIGGGRNPRPGEVSLATNGILFLDELPEFQREVLDALRQPLEDRQITVTRASATVVYPADFLLAISANPCPCGFSGSGSRQCQCSPRALQRYRSRFSGPLLDRIDIIVEVPAVEYKELQSGATGPSSAEIRESVTAARKLQQDRLAEVGLSANAQMEARHMRRYCQLDDEAVSLLRQAFKRMRMSLRGHDRVLKVARTIADLAGERVILAGHVAEALQFRAWTWERY